MFEPGPLVPGPELVEPARAHAPDLPEPRARESRIDGWLPDRQRAFLEAIADGHTVEAACRSVGLSSTSAYALRRRPAGAAFALGWRAAALLARERLADTLTSRAIDGQVDTYTRADGTEVTRHRHDNRLALQLLARLDRMAVAPAPDAPAPAGADAAQLVAGDFDRFLSLVEEGGEGAAAGLFAELAGEAERAARDPQLPQLVQLGRREAYEDGELFGEEPVWFDEESQRHVTSFPPPPDFEGREYGRYGEEDYYRQLSGDEILVIAIRDDEAIAERHAAESVERDAWFGFIREGAPGSDPEDPSADSPPPARSG